MGLLKSIQESYKPQKITFTDNMIDDFIKDFKKPSIHYGKGIVFLVNKEFNEKINSQLLIIK